MSYPAPVTTGSTSTLVFLLAAQSGIAIEGFSRKTDSKTVDFYAADLGYTTGTVFHDFKAMYDVKGKALAANASGVGSASPGVVVTLADTTTGNGVTSGGIYTMDTSLDAQGEQLRDFSISARQLPGIN